MLTLLIWWWADPGVFNPDPLAQGAPSPVNTSVFEQYGPIGIVAAVFASISWIMFRKYEQTLDLERQRSTRLEQEVRDGRQEVRELEKSIREQTTPALTQTSMTLAEVLKILERRRSKDDG